MYRCSGSENALDSLAEGISNLRRSLSSIRRKKKPSSTSGSDAKTGSVYTFSRCAHRSLKGIRSSQKGTFFVGDRLVLLYVLL